MARDQKLNVRLSEAEYEAVRIVARQEGLSLSDFARKAICDAGVRTVSATAGRLKAVGGNAAWPPRRSTRRVVPPPSVDELAGQFRVPFMRRKHGEPFRRVIHVSAHAMRCSQLSSARHATFILEAVAREVAKGEIVRLPGFGVFGPFSSENASGVEGCLPRFVAAAPFRDYVQAECHPRENRNKELKAAQRRRRTRPSSVVQAMETIRSHLTAQNRRAQELYEGSLDDWIAYGGA